jgi:hypothetical protein
VIRAVCSSPFLCDHNNLIKRLLPFHRVSSRLFIEILFFLSVLLPYIGPMQSESKKLNKGSTLDVLRCTHSQTRRAATRSDLFSSTKSPARLFPRCYMHMQRKGMLLSFSMLAIQFPSDKFETRDTAAAACISH